MSHVFVRFFMLFILSIAIQYGLCENCVIQSDTKCGNVILGSDKTRRWFPEILLSWLIWIKEIFCGKNDSQHEKNQSFGRFLENYFSTFIHLIYPGTLWCGSGNIASNENELGIFETVDACCREHDNCESNIEGGQTLINLNNNGIFTRSSCTCDKQFYDCLRNACNLIAFKIKIMYFNILRPQCFQCACPVTNCDFNNGTEYKVLCTKYEWVDSYSNILV